MGFMFWAANDNSVYYDRKPWKRSFTRKTPAAFGSWAWKACPAGKATVGLVKVQNERKEWHSKQRRAFRRFHL